MKAKKAKSGAGLFPVRQWLTLRVSAEEKQRVEEQAAIAGLSVSEYMRRTVHRVVALVEHKQGWASEDNTRYAVLENGK